MSSKPPPTPVPLVRTAAGGFLMGLANLVPGISGGTMILAVGLYDRFIGAVAEVTRLRPSAPAMRFLAVLALGLATALLAGSGVAVALVGEHRWIMYSLFIGMTLGGAPLLVRQIRPLSIGAGVAVAAGIAVMVAFAAGLGGAELDPSALVLVIAGAAAAASMILPGISGSYVLLILGLYDLVIGSLSAGALREDFAGSLRVIAPVVLGAGLGIGVLSNLLKVLLGRFSRASHGVLLGLLLGSVIGLWPFQEPVHADMASKPVRKATIMALVGEPGPAVRAKHGAEFDDARLAALAKKWEGHTPAQLKEAGEELRRFAPSAKQVASALALLVLGIGITRLIGRGEGRSEAAASGRGD